MPWSAACWQNVMMGRPARRAKTAWFMLHRIRLAMQTGSFIKSAGEFEVDETFIGGRAKNMSAARRAKSIPGGGVAGKEVVMGVRRRGTENEPSKAIAGHIKNRKTANVQAAVRAAAEPGSKRYTDAGREVRELGGGLMVQGGFVDAAMDPACG
jgi:stage V sporulation protein SpoVS